MPIATLNHESISYVDAGQGLPILFIHSLGTSGAVMFPSLEPLTAKFRVIAMDIRGHGGSSARGGVSTEGITRDAAALLDHLGIARAVIGGISMGGNIALHFFNLFPERVLGLVLSDTFSRFTPPAGIVALMNRATQVQQLGMEAMAQQYVAATLRPSASPAARAAVATAVAQVQPENYVATTAACFLSNYDHVLPTVNVPTLVLVGEHDPATPVATAQGLADRIRGAKLHIIPEAGHLSVLDNPEEYTGRLSAFLGELEPGEGW